MIVAFVISLLAMIFMSFINGEPKYQITAGIITIIGFVVILVLSESFNNLSLGKIINLRREVQAKEEEKIQVKAENKELRQELFKIISNVQQSQVNNTFNAPSDEWLKLLNVVKAQDADKEEDQEEQKEIQRTAMAEREKDKEESRIRMKQRKVAKAIGMSKYAASLSIQKSEMIREVEFSQAFDEIDPIMNRKIIFDGYIKGSTQERFIHIQLKNIVLPMDYDRLYVMLNKIYLYRQAKGISAELVLIMLEIEVEENVTKYLRAERFYEYFQSAISNKLLKIETVKVSQQEIESYENNGQQSFL